MAEIFSLIGFIRNVFGSKLAGEKTLYLASGTGKVYTLEIVCYIS
jgi:hypothetical protein